MLDLEKLASCVQWYPGIVSMHTLFVEMVSRQAVFTTHYAIGSSPFSGVPPMKPNYPPLSEATAKNPPLACGEAKTAQSMRQEIYEVFDGASIEPD